MIIDSHCHMFSPRTVENVKSRMDMVAELSLCVTGVSARVTPKSLVNCCAEANVEACLLLPTANPDKVHKENLRHMKMAQDYSQLHTLATLHPDMENLEDEISFVLEKDIAGFKMCSFSQKFELSSVATKNMFSMIERISSSIAIRPVVVMDTFIKADMHFGADPRFLTRPETLARIVADYEGIDFVAAHMGGLCAEIDHIRRHLVRRPNFYLDTSNAAHVLRQEEFIRLVLDHGPEKILFGTDWPWFDHRKELMLIETLLTNAGLNQEEKDLVFWGNASRLFGICQN